MASPLHRHQSSLEGILNFSHPPPPPLETELRKHASRKLYNICEYFDAGLPADNYSRPRLVRYTYEYSLSQESKDCFLRYFFQAIDLEISTEDILVSFENLRPKFFQFGDHLFDNFFLPVKASTKKTPQPSPALLSAVQDHSGQQYVGSGARLSILRRDCLIRDRHRCVISRKFDYTEAINRSLAPGGPRDDEGGLLENDPFDPDPLEVAHILPHSLTKTNERGELVRIYPTLIDSFPTKFPLRMLPNNLHLQSLICSMLALPN
ncbi:hypothetical protein F5Y14DRAFT_400039 [Nemania sp. NC0429]|nr:hypothetical protein F5Y14DRAFT_400039 [Nemania sp. NC0429]